MSILHARRQALGAVLLIVAGCGETSRHHGASGEVMDVRGSLLIDASWLLNPVELHLTAFEQSHTLRLPVQQMDHRGGAGSLRQYTWEAEVYRDASYSMNLLPIGVGKVVGASDWREAVRVPDPVRCCLRVRVAAGDSQLLRNVTVRWISKEVGREDRRGERWSHSVLLPDDGLIVLPEGSLEISVTAPFFREAVLSASISDSDVVDIGLRMYPAVNVRSIRGEGAVPLNLESLERIEVIGPGGIVGLLPTGDGGVIFLSVAGAYELLLHRLGTGTEPSFSIVHVDEGKTASVIVSIP